MSATSSSKSLRAVATALLASCLLVGPASAEILHWVDDAGVSHFTDRPEEVPPAYRDQVYDVTGELDGKRRFTLLGGPDEPAAGVAPQREAAPSLDPESWADLEQILEDGDMAGALGTLGAGMIGAVLLSLAVVLAICTALGALVLGIACRICREESPRFAKAAGIVALQMVTGIAASVVLALALGLNEPGPGSGAAQFGLSTVVNAGVLRGMLIETFGKAVLVSLVVTVVGFLVGIALLFAALCAGGTAALL